MQLELGLKEQGRAATPKPAWAALKSNSVQWDIAESVSFFSASAILSVPAQTAVNGCLVQVHEEFRAPQRIPL
jgi:hypothetical protein